MIIKKKNIWIKMSKILSSLIKVLFLDYNATASRSDNIFFAKLAGPAASRAKLVKYSTKNKVTFDIKKPFKVHKLEAPPSRKATYNTAEEVLKVYERMAIVRRLELEISKLYKDKIVRGFCHSYAGQEAVAVGMHSAMREVDTMITSYRCHGWVYLMGATPLSILAEVAGHKLGTCRGKGGSMHLFTRNFFGGNGIVGAQVPLGAGVALAHKYKNDGGVNFSLYGDGAANQGQLFEAMNMAKLLSLPCVFVCENNLYGMGTSAQRSSASTEYYKRGDYIPGIWVDGMDVNAAREATQFAIEYCTSGKGPLVLEMRTYRYTGHSMSDPGTTYRTRDEVQEVRQTQDPINLFKDKILAAKLATDEQIQAIDSKVRKELTEAVAKAKSDSVIGFEELAADVYKNCLEPNNLLRGINPNTPLNHITVASQQQS